MKSKILGIMPILIGLCLSSCEVEMELQEEGSLGYALNSIATTDTMLIAYVSNYYSIGGIIDEREKYNNFDDEIFFYIYNGGVNSGWRPNEYEYKGHVDNAFVTYSVNGQEMGHMNFLDGPKHYVADYRPKAGDVISIKAVDLHDASLEAHGSTKILEKSNFDIVDVTKTYMPKDGSFLDKDMSDTVVKIKVRLHDPAGEKNYYRLKVRSMNKEYTNFLSMSDVFWSDDPLFYDENLWMKIGNWRPGTTPFFDDSSFDGKDREFTVYHRPVNKTHYSKYDRYLFYVDVQSITMDVYLHQKSLVSYIQSGESTYGEPLLLHSNTSTGFGIVGGVTSNRHYIDINVEEGGYEAVP